MRIWGFVPTRVFVRKCIGTITYACASAHLLTLSQANFTSDPFQQASEDSESDPDLVGPPIKRARTRTDQLTASDTDESDVDEERHSHSETIVTDEENVLPFAESEYESIMDGR